MAKRYISGKHLTDAIEVAKEIQKLEPKSPEGTQLLRTANEGLAAHWLSEAQSFLKKGDLKNAEWLARRSWGRSIRTWREA